MSLYKRRDSRVWWASIHLPDGGRICRSTGTEDRKAAQEWLDQTKAKLWRVHRLGERPTYTWQEAVVRWCEEKAHKATLREDMVKFVWLDQFLHGRLLHTITRDDIQALGRAKAKETSQPTANRYLALVRAVLKRAAGMWEWVEKAPAVTLYPEAKKRVRYLSPEDAGRLLPELPVHQRQMWRFALATGLRQGNVLGLEWEQIDLTRRVAWIHADQAKGRQAIGVPLNDLAVAVLREEWGKHPTRVFTYRGRPIGQANTRSWRRALKRAGIEEYRWHDNRHTWATWHVKAGTSLGELQDLGGWKSEAMVRRYAHFTPEHLRVAADRLATFLSTATETKPPESTQNVDSVAPRPGLEPGTCGLTVRKKVA